jgi:hypothetical protein
MNRAYYRKINSSGIKKILILQPPFSEYVQYLAQLLKHDADILLKN